MNRWLWALFVMIAAVLPGRPVKEIGAPQASPVRPDRSVPSGGTGNIVFLRPKQPREWEGDLWLVSASGQHERRLTTSGGFRGLSSDSRRVACVDRNGIYVLSPPDWQPKRVGMPPLPSVPVTEGLPFHVPPEKTWLSGGTCWRPGADQLFVGAGLGDAGDGGLWLVHIDRHTIRRILPPVDADFPMNDEIKLSPGGTRVAAGGGAEMYFWVRIADLRTGKQFQQPGRRGILGMNDFAWLDEDNLLLAGAPDTDWDGKGHPEYGKGGIRRLNLRTGRITPWLYTVHTSVYQLLRSPGGDRLAVLVDPPMQEAKRHDSSNYVVLVDTHTKAQRLLSTPGPPGILGFSPGRTQLLINVGTGAEEGHVGDLYALDLRQGGSHLIARNVMEAVWVGTAQPSVVRQIEGRG
jgi:hypothetical protein